MEKMRHFIVTVDYNDADYVSDLVSVTEEEFQRFLPLIEAINDFQPYIYKLGVCYNNWETARPDLYEMTPEQKYPQFSEELIDDFRDKFTSIHNPEEAYGGVFHSIISIQEVQLGKEYVRGDYQTLKSRNKEMVEEYHRRKNELYGFGTSRNLYVMQDKDKTEEEKERCRKAWNLWREYRPDLKDADIKDDY